MGSSFVLPGVPPLAWFKSLTLSFSCVGKTGIRYEMRKDEIVPVYIQNDVEAFQAHRDLVQTNKDGEPVPGSGLNETPEPKSYKKYGAPTSINRSVLGIDKTSKIDSEVAKLEARRQAQLRQFKNPGT